MTGTSSFIVYNNEYLYLFYKEASRGYRKCTSQWELSMVFLSLLDLASTFLVMLESSSANRFYRLEAHSRFLIPTKSSKRLLGSVG